MSDDWQRLWAEHASDLVFIAWSEWLRDRWLYGPVGGAF